ncbi:MAG: hypothetical protein WCO98_02915 [bacterium]
MKKCFYLSLAMCIFFTHCFTAEVNTPTTATTPEKSIEKPAVTPEPDKLEVILNNNGLQKLSYGNYSFFRHPSDGDLTPFARTPIFQKDKETRIDSSATISRVLNSQTSTILQTYSWGLISAIYDIHDTRLDITVTVTNKSPELLSNINLQFARMTFPQVPKVSFVGQDPFEFNGGSGAVNAMQRPPVVLVDYGKAAYVVAGNRYTENFTAGVFFAEDKGNINRTGIGLTDISPGTSKTAVLSLCFGKKGDTLRSLGGEFIDAYAHVNPMTLRWPDRRPIGKIFLASSGNGPDQMENNPNRWFMNAKDVNISNDEGKEVFREKLLKYADTAIDALKKLEAQGGITWDPEGQRTGHTYYGDPRIIPDIAPEMEYRGKHDTTTIDAYFNKFKEAKLYHGICIRPQHVTLKDKYWVQEELKTSIERLAELDAKISYAVKRWDTKLFYIDSDYAVTAWEYRELHARYPDVLLIPEWETPLHYAYTAPLQSFSHFGISNAQTPPSIRDLYPKSFIVTFADGAKAAKPDAKEALLAGIRGGDIMMVNAWYVTGDFDTIKEFYAATHPIEKKADK